MSGSFIEKVEQNNENRYIPALVVCIQSIFTLSEGPIRLLLTSSIKHTQTTTNRRCRCRCGKYKTDKELFHDQVATFICEVFKQASEAEKESNRYSNISTKESENRKIVRCIKNICESIKQCDNNLDLCLKIVIQKIAANREGHNQLKALLNKEPTE